MRKLKIKHPWRSGLIISTMLSSLVFCATLLWQAGYAQWAFLLLFVAMWLMISLFLINEEFNEESGLILASVLDDNVDQLLDRIHHLEQKLLMLAHTKDNGSAEQSPHGGSAET